MTFESHLSELVCHIFSLILVIFELYSFSFRFHKRRRSLKMQTYLPVSLYSICTKMHILNPATFFTYCTVFRFNKKKHSFETGNNSDGYPERESDIQLDNSNIPGHIIGEFRSVNDDAIFNHKYLQVINTQLTKDEKISGIKCAHRTSNNFIPAG